MSDSNDAAGPRVRPLALLALILASVWILTGALFKLLQGSPALLPAFMHDLPLSVETIYPLVIGIELGVVAIALLRPREGWILVTLQYLAFFSVLGIQIARGEESCGCMGKNVELAPTTMLAIDGALFALLMVSRPWSGLGRIVVVGLFVLPRFVGRGQAIDPAEVLGKIESAPGAFVDGDPRVDPGGAATRTDPPVTDVLDPDVVANPDGDQPGASPTQPGTETIPAPAPPAVTPEAQGWTVLSPDKWIGKDVFDIDLAQWTDVGMLPLDGTWIFYRTTCEHCRDHLIEVANADDGSKLIGLIRVPDPGDSPDNRIVHIMPQGGHVMHVELPAGVEYVLTTPADAEIVGGVVQTAREGF